MPRLDLGPLGANLEVRGRDGYPDDAVELEGMGYSTIWITGGQLQTLDPLARTVRATNSVSVGSAIIPADVYGAGAAAAAFADIDATHPGRFIAGVGGAHGPRPLQGMRAYLDELDAADPPIPASGRMLAALGPRMLELARDRTAGAHPMLVTPEYTAQARAALGAASTLVIGQLVSIERDAAVAREAARAPLRFLSGVGGYTSNFRRMGFSEPEVAGLDDRFVDSVVAWGDADAVAARVTEHLDAGADQVAIGVLATETGPAPMDQLARLAGRLIGRDARNPE